MRVRVCILYACARVHVCMCVYISLCTSAAFSSARAHLHIQALFGTSHSFQIIVYIVMICSGSNHHNGVCLGCSEMLRSLRHDLWAWIQGHHNHSQLDERCIERGSLWGSSFKGPGRVIINQTNIGSVSKTTLGKLLWNRVELIWDFPSAYIPSWIIIIIQKIFLKPGWAQSASQ